MKGFYEVNYRESSGEQRRILCYCYRDKRLGIDFAVIAPGQQKERGDLLPGDMPIVARGRGAGSVLYKEGITKIDVNKLRKTKPDLADWIKRAEARGAYFSKRESGPIIGTID